MVNSKLQMAHHVAKVRPIRRATHVIGMKPLFAGIRLLRDDYQPHIIVALYIFSVR